MSKKIGSMTTITPTATGDSTADLVDATYPMAIQGINSTQRNVVYEVQLGGQAATSAPTIMVLSRDVQVATGSLTKSSGLHDALLDGSGAESAAIATVFNSAATLKPRRSTTAHLLNLSFNAFGGIVRWVAAPGEEVTMVGNTASNGELSLSAFTGGTTGLLGAHMVYETL